ncbi:hypothetical protein I3843_15G040000 [Carya illinoinensis]|uniref:Uncharacterized protein n=1 Tax=Carya illinoinensis TaxID=32201 RepID=A0A922D6D9_CARIL|nr:hypothetical protein I3842_15G043900 [Carya illinoinensis]KAG7943454.1 hypothetical protein I3843_15G040000 [Carya illinoinensis]
MSALRSGFLCSGIPVGTSRRSPVSFRNPSRVLITSKRDIRSCFLGNGRSFQFLSIGLGDLIASTTKLGDMAVDSSSQPGPMVPSDPSPDSWKIWIVGMAATVILPFLGIKFGPFMQFKKQIDSAMQIAEDVAEAAENVAEQVEKVAEDIADDLPAGGKLKDAVTFIENLAKETAEDAHRVDELIDKVQEVEEKVDSFIEPDTDKAKAMPKEANGPKQN